MSDYSKPGPGAYNPSDFLSKDKVPTALIPKSNRADIVSAEARSSPGPGIYDSGKKFGEGVPTHSIRGRPRD